MRLVAEVDVAKCTDCSFCRYVAYCPLDHAGCVGCGACVEACPQGARRLVEAEETTYASVLVDGALVEVPAHSTIKVALVEAGIKLAKHPIDVGFFMPCEVGACYTCLVKADGEVVRACVTPVRDGMEVSTDIGDFTPVRVVHGPEGHPVGGKATPWWVKSRHRYVEVAVWVGGCLYRCPQCQNYHVTYDGRSVPMEPEETAKVVSIARREYGVDRMAISGGEPTINRPWLTRYFKELKRLNPDERARLHLDSNGAVLTEDYIDELVLECGVTDIGVEPKGVRVETFMEITGIEDRELARKYLETAWAAVKYIADNYLGKVFLGVGMPYNSAFMSMEEVAEFGDKLASIDPNIQLCVLDYFPTFRRKDITRPSPREMLKVKEVLEGTGLKCVVVQTSVGHFGPAGRIA